MIRILLVEDYENIRTAYYIALTQEGFQTDTAGSGKEALDHVAVTTYDLICLDMVMLQYSGMEFLEAFRATQPQSKSRVIVLSNIDSPKIIERAKTLGVEKYLLKSDYTPKQLVEVIREELGLPGTAPSANPESKSP